MSKEWKLKLDSGIHARFFRENGESEPGTDCFVSLSDGVKQWKVIVRVFENEFPLPSPELGDLVLRFIKTKLAEGWTPDQYKSQPGELTIPKNFPAF